MNDKIEHVKERFQRFADLECKGYSDFYYRLAQSVAADEELARFIAEMPDPQPNLFLASVQYLTGPEGMPANGVELGSFVKERGRDVGLLMRSHRTQTNEVGRCAVLLPALPDGPLALVEVGASAGLCLMPDRFRYDYGSAQIGDARSPVRLSCILQGSRPRLAIPRIVWRHGLDLDPVDLNDEAARRWLLSCVWPDHVDRRRRLEAAIEYCRTQAPRVRRGDLVDDLPALLADAPGDSTLVVFHSAVLPYVSAERRRTFVEVLVNFSKRRDLVWISNESPRALPEIAVLAPPPKGSRFLLGRTTIRKGHKSASLLGLAHPHGANLDWLDGCHTNSSVGN